MQQMNDRQTGQNKVNHRSVWRSADGQTELFIPVGAEAPAQIKDDFSPVKAIQNERAKKVVKYACCAGGGGLALYGVGLMVVTYWVTITVGALFVALVALVSKLVADTQYKRRYSYKDEQPGTGTKNAGQTIINNYYYNSR